MQYSIPLDIIRHNPWQTRVGEPDAAYVQELADDIAANTMLQIPIGRALIDGVQVSLSQETLVSKKGLEVQLAFGHNRLAAYRKNFFERGAGWGRMPVEIRRLSDEQMATLAWSENEKRRDHSPYERALAIQKRIEAFGWSQAQVAEKLGISRPAVSNTLRLLKLPEEALSAMGKGEISERAAMALVSLYDLPETVLTLAANSYDMKPARIIQEALDGRLTSDAIRHLTEQIINRYANKLEEAEFGLDETYTGAPACRDCSVRHKERNLCMDKECFARKTMARRAAYLEQASQARGIPAIEDLHKSKFEVTQFGRYTLNGNKFEAALAAKCSNLRLMYDKAGSSDRDDPARVKEYPDAIVVCGKREQFCTCLKGMEKLRDSQQQTANSRQPTADSQKLTELAKKHHLTIETDDEGEYLVDENGAEVGAEAFEQEHEEKISAMSAEELKRLAQEARREKREAQQQAKFVIQETAERIAAGLSLRNVDTWIAYVNIYNYEDHKWTSRDLWEIFLAFGTKMAERRLPYEITSMQRVIERMNGLLKECGLEEIKPVKDEADAPRPVVEGKKLVEVFADEIEEYPGLSPLCICGHEANNHCDETGCGCCVCETYEPVEVE